jgi:uncharacterized protein (TIGR02284 family)
MMASNSNLPNPGFASAGEDKHWKFACDSGARVPGEKRSFANHHGLEPENWPQRAPSVPDEKRSFSQAHKPPEEIGREGGQSQGGNFANGDAVGNRRTLRTRLDRRKQMDKVISTLNTLLETTKDGEHGFRTCAEAVTNPRLKTMFEDAARRCDGGAAELQAKILGGEPATSGTASGALHRAWTNIKSSITGMDEYAVLTECERGEDVAKSAYEEALNEDLPMDIKTLVQRQYEGVKANHDRIRQLRNQAAHL